MSFFGHIKATLDKLETHTVTEILFFSVIHIEMSTINYNSR